MARSDRIRQLGQARRHPAKLGVLALGALICALMLAACSGRKADAGADPSVPEEASGGVPSALDAQSPVAPATVDTTTTTGSTCARAYSDDSPWNTPIGPTPEYHPRSDGFVQRIEVPLTSDPTQFSYPVYRVDEDTPRRTVRLDGWFSNVVNGGNLLLNQRAGTVDLPIPEGARPSAGEDAQIVLYNEETDEEWGASVLRESDDGTFDAFNAYHYDTAWTAFVPFDEDGRPIFARGAGIPYLAGLIRPCEVEQGLIDHALAFSFDAPRDAFVPPASKSDGASSTHLDVPEGARLQLDPTISEAEISAWGCRGPCLAVARALQKYGMIVVDNAGRSKIYFEFDGTAHWNGRVQASTVSPIPVDRLSVLAFDTPTLDR